MISIITGDIINSRNIAVEKWLPILKDVFNTVGTTPKVWEIYRGDSFQIEITDPKNAFLFYLQLKTTIKKFTDLDIRLAIGIGKKDFDAKTITESNGEAFINSGYAFDNYLKKQTLAIKTPWKDLDEVLNTLFDLALLTMDNWSINSVELAKIVFENSTIRQADITKLLNISQSSVSERRKRAGLDEILRLEKLYRKLIEQKTV